MTRLKELRIERNITQQELAAMTNINVRTLQYYEQGINKVDHARLDTILKLCVALKCEIGDIMEETDWYPLYENYMDVNFPE